MDTVEDVLFQNDAGVILSECVSIGKLVDGSSNLNIRVYGAIALVNGSYINKREMGIARTESLRKYMLGL